MNIPRQVAIVEVGPRDGFQMEKTFIPTKKKVEVINAISSTGVRKIETTSFVSSKVIPQMADAAEVMRSVDRVPGIKYTVLVPNLKGAERGLQAGADGFRLVICASETYNRRNVGQSVMETFRECESVLRFTNARGVSTDVTIGLAFGCPLEGSIPQSRVVQMVRQLTKMGFEEICIADSVGLGNPAQVGQMMRRLLDEFPGVVFSLHIHDTRGLGLANVLAGLEEGVAIFDSSIGGLGGCPVVAGATGNIATEDLANMLNEMGIETGVDTHKVIECARMVQTLLGRTLPSHVLQAGTPSHVYAGQKHSSSGGCQVIER